ncbi:hypothetical protein Hdeb2414_s0006g00210591 [Helianthus debilis subsp. tardiflorus]
METAINHQSVENLLQNLYYLSIIIAYVQFMFNRRFKRQIASSVFESESSVSVFLQLLLMLWIMLIYVRIGALIVAHVLF